MWKNVFIPTLHTFTTWNIVGRTHRITDVGISCYFLAANQQFFWKNSLQSLKKVRNPEYAPGWLVLFFFLFFDILFDRKKIGRLLKAISLASWFFLEMWRFFQKISHFSWNCHKTFKNQFMRYPNHSEVISDPNFP